MSSQVVKQIDNDRTDYPFYEVHNFIRDRTRSIRQDFTYQGIQDERVVEIIEQITRFHVLSQHRLCEEPSNSHPFEFLHD